MALMRPPHVVNKEFLTRRYDLSKYQGEELHWEFYDSYHEAKNVKLAVQRKETSIENHRLDKYIQLAHVKPPEPKPDLIPPPFNKLLPLQAKNGRWEDPIRVKKVLNVPLDLQLEGSTKWEEATAFALAAIRITPALFDVLVEHHDKAFPQITDKSLIHRAAHMIGTHERDIRDEVVVLNRNGEIELEKQKEFDRTALIPKYSMREPPGAGRNNSINGVDGVNDGYYNEKFNNSLATSISIRGVQQGEDHEQDISYDWNDDSRGLVRGVTNTELMDNAYGCNATSSVTGTESPGMFMLSPNRKSISYKGLASGLNTPGTHRVSTGGPSTPVTITESPGLLSTTVDSKLADRLQSTIVRRDEACIRRLTEEINMLKMEIIDVSTLIDRHIEMLKECLLECAIQYGQAETHATRNVAFDKFTAMVGDGAKPRHGLSDWRAQGVKGYRPLVVKCLGFVYELAQKRLILAEIEEPGRLVTDSEGKSNGGEGDVSIDLTGYKVSDANIRVCPTDRWTFIWDGDNIIHKILHSLDFMRQSAELSEWYGRMYYFVANPLGLPFAGDLENCLEPLGMLSKIQQERTSLPFNRTSPNDLAKDWQYQAYLVEWCNCFATHCGNKHAFNWPALPAVREDSDRNKIYVAMLMLYTKCYEEILNCVVEERKMIQLLGTHRGKNMLTWQSNVVPKVTTRVVVPTNRKNVPVENFVDAVLEHRASVAVSAVNVSVSPSPILGKNLSSPTGSTKPKPLPAISSNAVSAKVISAKPRNSHILIGASTEASGVVLTTSAKQLTAAADKTWRREGASNDKYDKVTRRTVVSAPTVVKPNVTIDTNVAALNVGKQGIGSTSRAKQASILVGKVTNKTRLRADTMTVGTAAPTVSKAPSTLLPSLETASSTKSNGNLRTRRPTSGAKSKEHKLAKKLSILMQQGSLVSETASRGGTPDVGPGRRSVISRVPVSSMHGTKMTRRSQTSSGK